MDGVMRLWLLKVIDGAPGGPWERDCYGVHFGFVVRAESEAVARQIACDAESGYAHRQG